jgi:hypothetical protein
MFGEPYVDADEWRDSPVHHRYVHGGFRGTETRFSVYLPPEASYRGRFFQHITPVLDSEHLARGQGQHLHAPAESGAGTGGRELKMIRPEQCKWSRER